MKLSKNSTYLVAALVISALLITSAAIAGKGSSAKSGVKKEQTSTESTSKAPASSSKVEKTPTKVTAKKAESDALQKHKDLLRSQGTTLEEINIQIHAPQTASNAPATGEQINWQVLSGGGGSGSSASFQLTSVVGQTAVGFGSSPSFGLNHGFLQSFGPTTCCDVAGDANNSGSVTIGDVTFLIARIFSGGAAPDCCEEGDANGSANITIGDVTYLIARIFSGGAAPVCGPAGMSCMIS